MIADFDRYLKNTTIFRYKTKNTKWPIFQGNPNYRPIKIGWVYFFSIQSFSWFIENLIKIHKIKVDKNKSNMYAIYKHIVKKKYITDYNELDCIKSIFINLDYFLEKIIWEKIIWEKINSPWPIPNYTNTDVKNVYCAIWNDTIKRIFKGNHNIEKIRQTRNKFIEHNTEEKIKKNGDDFRRKVIIRWWWDNITWKINMKIHLNCEYKEKCESNKCEGKEYEFSLCPLLDFCVFINEIIKHPLS